MYFDCHIDFSTKQIVFIYDVSGVVVGEILIDFVLICFDTVYKYVCSHFSKSPYVTNSSHQHALELILIFVISLSMKFKIKGKQFIKGT